MTRPVIGKTWINGKLVYYADYVKEIKDSFKKKKKKKKKDHRVKHGMAAHKYAPVNPTYKAWQKMKDANKRRLRPGGLAYHIHEPWLDQHNGFTNFLKDMGEKPKHRNKLKILNPDIGYAPGNCIWMEIGIATLECASCKKSFTVEKHRKRATYCSTPCRIAVQGFKSPLFH